MDFISQTNYEGKLHYVKGQFHLKTEKCTISNVPQFTLPILIMAPEFSSQTENFPMFQKNIQLLQGINVNFICKGSTSHTHSVDMANTRVILVKVEIAAKGCSNPLPWHSGRRHHVKWSFICDSLYFTMAFTQSPTVSGKRSSPTEPWNSHNIELKGVTGDHPMRKGSTVKKNAFWRG